MNASWGAMVVCRAATRPEGYDAGRATGVVPSPPPVIVTGWRFGGSLDSQPADPTANSDWPQWRKLIAEEIRAETPELTADEAEFRAARLANEAWQAKANTDRRNELRIGEICRENDLEGDLFVGTERWGVLGDDNKTRLRPVADEDLPPWHRTGGDVA